MDESRRAQSKVEVIEEQVDEERGKDEVTMGVFGENTNSKDPSMVFLPGFRRPQNNPSELLQSEYFTFPQQEHCFLRLKGNSRHSMRSTKSFMIQNQANPQCGCGIVSGMLADYSVDEIYDRSSWLFEIHDV